MSAEPWNVVSLASVRTANANAEPTIDPQVGGTGSGGGQMDARIAKLESDVDNIKSNVGRIFAVLGGGFLLLFGAYGGGYIRLDNKTDANMEKADRRFESVDAKLDSLKDDIHRLDLSAQRIELNVERIADAVTREPAPPPPRR